MSDPAFTLRIRGQHGTTITIRAYDDLVPSWDQAGRVRLTVEVRDFGRVIFPKGQLTCALHGASDSVAAKELVMTLVAMHPSNGEGTGDEYYADYTPEQMAWCKTHGEALDMVRQDRYCDPGTGECRRTAARPHRLERPPGAAKVITGEMDAPLVERRSQRMLGVEPDSE